MWNPNAYRDTDYGLDESESFEPEIEIDDDFVPQPGEPYIQTVLGPIQPEEAGVALVYEYLQWRPTGNDSAYQLGDPQAAMTDLEAFFSASGRTVVSAATTDTGRDAAVLVTLARHAPVHLVAATGGIGTTDPEALAAEIDRELRDGLDGTGVKPGIIVASVAHQPDPGALSAMLDMLVTAQRKSGLPVTITCDDPSSIVPVLEAGFLSDGLMVTGKAVEDVEVAQRIVAAESFVLFASMNGGGDDRNIADDVAQLSGAGHLPRILISHGFRRRSKLNGYGGQPGLAFIVEQFAVMLLEAGLEALDVRTMLVDNAARALTLQQAGAVA